MPFRSCLRNSLQPPSRHLCLFYIFFFWLYNLNLLYLGLVDLKFTFVYGGREGSTFVFLQISRKLPQLYTVKNPFLPTDMRCHLFHLSSTHMSASVFWRTLFCFIVLFVHFYITKNRRELLECVRDSALPPTANTIFTREILNAAIVRFKKQGKKIVITTIVQYNTGSCGQL